MFNLDPYYLAALVPGIILGLTLHEYAHAKVADLLGDPTARLLGRVTLDPLKHLDPLGTILLFVVGFGWAKPVPVTLSNIRGNQRLGEIWISLAGPATNFVLAVVFRLMLNLFGASLGSIGQDILDSAYQINVVLAALNLLPIPPLDGSAVLMNLWRRPPRWLWFLQTNGTFVLLFFIFTGLFRYILSPVIGIIHVAVIQLAGLIS